jgi:phosphoserine phosphatase RsbU/P
MKDNYSECTHRVGTEGSDAVHGFGSGQGERKPTVLIVDDQPINIKLLEAVLKREGYLTRVALSGSEGERIAKALQPDIILLDIMMPGKSGFETCADLKRNPSTNHIPIIFLSALNDIANKVKGLGMGAVDYITKPFHRDEVLARTRLHLSMRAAHQMIVEDQAARLRQIREAQQTILVQPDEMPQARFAVRYVPVLEAGGDFYDVFEMAPGVTAYFVADVSGHDLGASFTTAALKALIRQKSGHCNSPLEVMAQMNDALSTIMTEGKHLTASYARLDRTKGELTVVSAGHPPLIYVEVSGRAEWMGASGDILGVFPFVELEALHREVSGGDRFYLYTDGLIERFAGKKRSRGCGAEELKRICQQAVSMPLDRAVPAIVESLLPSGASLEDDIVLLGVEV